MIRRITLLAACALLCACPRLELDEPLPYAFVVYDLAAGELPMPNDVLRNAETGLLEMPVDDPEASPADIELREYLNTLDAWSTTFAASMTLSEPVDPLTVDEGSVQLWEWGAEPARVQDSRMEISEDGREITFHPPPTGWVRGGTYVVLVRGGPDGLKSADGIGYGPDTSFWYLRQAENLVQLDHQRAFPGADRAERLSTAAELEALRLGLEPYFAHFGDSVRRDDVAALWSFTITDRTELAMDRESQRVPVPFDLLIDPETGLVSLTPSDGDSELEADAKVVANTMTGFGVSANPYFELTKAVDPSTVTPQTVKLYDVAQTAQELPIALRVFTEDGTGPCEAPPYDEDCRRIVIDLLPEVLPLQGDRTYAVVVTDGVKDLEGNAPEPMLIGHFVRGEHPLTDLDGNSLVPSLDDETARRLEGVRVKSAPLLDALGRDNIVAAWPFTTLDAMPAIRESARMAESMGWDAEPEVEERLPPYNLFGRDALEQLFPGPLNPAPEIYALRTAGVREVITGSIPAPDFLDPVTRRMREDGGHSTKDLEFWATVPENVNPDEPIPLVIFGHAIVTDRRWLITISGHLAQHGMAAVAIDWPYHGEGVYCVDSSLVAVPNIFPEALRPVVGFEENLIWMPPCVSGDDATCSPTGECLDANGDPEPFTTFPIIDMKPASGAAFLDTNDLPYIPDHFHQALIDMSTLKHSLDTEDWSGLLGQQIRTDGYYYAGQSLGSIIGSVWVSAVPDIERMVFNVIGSNMVELFRNSTYFQPQIDEYFVEQDIAEGSWEQERLMNVAKWLIDSIDPHTIAHTYADRDGLIQIAKVNDSAGDIIIPNFTTENFQRVSGLEMVEYPTVLHADLIVPLIGNSMLDDMADFLSGDWNQ